jgi:hypothetical protein
MTVACSVSTASGHRAGRDGCVHAGTRLSRVGRFTFGDFLVTMCRLALRGAGDTSKLPVAVVDEEQEAGYPDVGELTDDQLEAELTIAASTPDHRRIDRYQALLAERDRRDQERS